jgi:glycosyl hydrolase family 42 (putative beta-galactosidase)
MASDSHARDEANDGCDVEQTAEHGSPIRGTHCNAGTCHPSRGTGGIRGTVLKSILIVPAIVAFTTAFAVANIRQPNGFYVMQGLHQTNVSDDVLNTPSLSGIHLRDQWQLLEPAPDTYSFTWLDGQIARAKSLGKQATLGIYAGTSSPAWLNVPLVNGVPIPWDPAVTAAHDGMVAALGAHYRDETDIAAVHISAPPTNQSLEMYFPDGLQSVPGYSDANIITSWDAAIDAYSAAFPNNALVLDVAMVPDVGGAITNAVIDYARQVLGDRANFIHCSLKATTPPGAPIQQTIVGLRQDGARIGFEMVSPSTDVARFGGPFTDALAIGQAAGASWYQIYQADVPSIPYNFFGVPGDYNGDGVVNAADFTVWRDSVGQIGPGLAADGNINGQIDAGDYNVWLSHFGQTAGGGSSASANAAVPEPTTLWILLVGILTICSRRWQKGRKLVNA